MPSKEETTNKEGAAVKVAPEQHKDWHLVVSACDADGLLDVTPVLFQIRCRDLARALGCEYWGIYHDRDRLPDGRPKYLHYHLILHMKRSRRVKTAVLKAAVKAFQVAENRVSVMPSFDLEIDIRYLMHLDDEDKFLYSLHDVITSDERTLLLAFNNSLNVLTFERLKEAYEMSGGSRIGIMQIIGLKLYRLNWAAIRDYIEEMKGYKINAQAKTDEDREADEP